MILNINSVEIIAKWSDETGKLIKSNCQRIKKSLKSVKLDIDQKAARTINACCPGLEKKMDGIRGGSRIFESEKRGEGFGGFFHYKVQNSYALNCSNVSEQGGNLVQGTMGGFIRQKIGKSYKKCNFFQTENFKKKLDLFSRKIISNAIWRKKW